MSDNLLESGKYEDLQQSENKECEEGKENESVTKESEQNKPKVPIIFLSSSVAVQSLLVGLHLIINSKMLSMLSDKETGASSIVSTFQTVTIATGTGFIYATGIELGKVTGRGEFKQAGEIAKASWVLSLLFGSACSIAMVSSRGIFPLLYSEETARIASDFLTGYSMCGIPMMMMVSSPQVAFQAGDWYIPTVSGALFTVFSGLSSYLLAFPQDMGAFGVGLGGSIGGLLSICIIQSLLCREHYAKYQLHNLAMGDLSNNLRKLLRTGAQLSLQRVTEWGNFFAITTVIGAADSTVLAATPPVVQCTMILALSMQGLAHASAMLILNNKGQIELAIGNSNQVAASKWHRKNAKILLTNNVAGTVLSIAAVVIVYMERKQISELLLGGVDHDTQLLAENLLWIGMIGSIPDTIRIISLGALRSWKDVLYPTLACLIAMTIIGVPVGYAVSTDQHDWSYMFTIRNIVLLFSALMMVHRCREHLQEDNKKIYNQLHGSPERKIEKIVTQGPGSSGIISYLFPANKKNRLHYNNVSLDDDHPSGPLLQDDQQSDQNGFSSINTSRK